MPPGLQDQVVISDSNEAVVRAAKAALRGPRVALAVYLALDDEPMGDGWTRSVIDQENGAAVIASRSADASYSFLTLQFEQRTMISGPNDEPPRSWIMHDTEPDEALRNTNIETLHWLLGATDKMSTSTGNSVLCDLGREQAIANSAAPAQTKMFLQHEQARTRVSLQDGVIAHFTLIFDPIKRRLRLSQPGSRMFVAVETGPTVPVLDIKPSDDHATLDRFTSDLLENWPGSDRVNYDETPATHLLELGTTRDGTPQVRR